MEKILMFLAGFSLLIFPLNYLALAQENKDYQAWIVTKSENSHLKIEAYCRNNSSEDSILRYKLKTQKRGETGKTVSFQSGSVFIPAQEEKLLSQFGLRISPEDKCRLKLEVYKEGKLVTEDFVVYPPELKIWI